MTSMVLLGESTLEYLTPSVNAPLDLYLHIAFVRWKLQFLPSHGGTQGENELLIKSSCYEMVCFNYYLHTSCNFSWVRVGGFIKI
jgi:hypothetical protein